MQREKRVPRVDPERLSIWLIAVFGLAIFFGGAYLGRFSGNFSGDSLDPALIPQPKTHGPSGPGGEQATELSQADRGKKIFSANCAVCHQPNGLGAAGQGYPPAARSEYVHGGAPRVGRNVVERLVRAPPGERPTFCAPGLPPRGKKLDGAENAAGFHLH